MMIFGWEIEVANENGSKVKVPAGTLVKWTGWLIAALVAIVTQIIPPLLPAKPAKPSLVSTIGEEKILALLETAAVNRTNIEALRVGQNDLKDGLARIERKVDSHISRDK
jgi:hypothetical protein